MSPEIMGFQMDSNHFACFIHNLSRCRIRNREYSLVGRNPFPGYVFFQTICNLLRDKHDLPFLAALGGLESELSILDITRGQFQYLANPHSATSHQLKNQPVPGFDGTEDDFIYEFLFQNGPTDGSRGTIELLQHRGVTGTSEVWIEILGDEVEKGGELGMPSVFG